MAISESVLRRLPAGSFIRVEKIRNMDDNETMAIVWSWKDEYTFRVSYFDKYTGDYLGEV